METIDAKIMADQNSKASPRKPSTVTANVSARYGILNRFRENRIFRLTHGNHVHDSTAANTSLVDSEDSIIVCAYPIIRTPFFPENQNTQCEAQ
jgi:hypothetical protein